MSRTAPFRYWDSSPTRKRAALAMSSRVPARPDGTWSVTWATVSAGVVMLIAVAVHPGEIILVLGLIFLYGQQSVHGIP